jgi:hypothetical protein
MRPGFKPHIVSTVAVNDTGYPYWKKGEVEKHLSRAWTWIEGNLLIEPSPEPNGLLGWKLFTDKGEAIARGANIEEILNTQQFPRGLLHGDIIARCETLFSTRHYAEAAEFSFRVVRERLRQLRVRLKTVIREQFA